MSAQPVRSAASAAHSSRAIATAASLGLGPSEAAILAGIQPHLVARQVAGVAAAQRHCLRCARRCATEDHRSVRFASLFGDVPVRVPRFRDCACRSERRRARMTSAARGAPLGPRAGRRGRAARHGRGVHARRLTISDAARGCHRVRGGGTPPAAPGCTWRSAPRGGRSDAALVVPLARRTAHRVRRGCPGARPPEGELGGVHATGAGPVSLPAHRRTRLSGDANGRSAIRSRRLPTSARRARDRGEKLAGDGRDRRPPRGGRRHSDPASRRSTSGTTIRRSSGRRHAQVRAAPLGFPAPCERTSPRRRR